MSNSDDPYIRSATPSTFLRVHSAARAKDPTVPPIARPYWGPGGPISTLGLRGIEERVKAASESGDSLSLSFLAQDPDLRVRQTVARNPNLPRILRDTIRGETGYSPEQASEIWLDVWKTNPEDFIDEHRWDSRLPNVLVARGYFAEDFDDVETARLWNRAASNIGVMEARANLARLSADEGDLKTAREWALPAARQGNKSAQKVLASLGEKRTDVRPSEASGTGNPYRAAALGVFALIVLVLWVVASTA